MTTETTPTTADLMEALENLLEHVNDLRDGFSVKTETDETMLRLGKPAVAHAANLIKNARNT